jgi:hypothetical protein
MSPNNNWHRKKFIAVILAVIFGPWTWLYTYRRDPGKAAIGLGSNLSFLFIFILMFVNVKVIDPPPSDSNAGESVAYLGLAVLMGLFATWLAATITAVASKNYHLEGRETRVKTTAILCAVYLGPWTWLYTHKRDYWKFWPAIIIGFGGYSAFTLLALPSLLRLLWVLACLAIWITAIVDTVLRNRVWYDIYGGSIRQ